MVDSGSSAAERDSAISAVSSSVSSPQDSSRVCRTILPARRQATTVGFAAPRPAGNDRREILISRFCASRTTGGRAALPYESAHDEEGGEQMLMGKARARVYNVFKKHALRLGQSLNLPEDHLSFECDFMAVLAERTKERLAEGDDAEALRLLTTQRSFLARHIASWYPRFAQLALSLSKERFYHGALEFAQDFFALDANLLDDAIAAVEDETGLHAEDVALDMEWLETPPRDDGADRAGDEAWKAASC